MTRPDALRSVQRVWKKHFGSDVDAATAEQILQACQELYPIIHDQRIQEKFGWDFTKDVVIDPPAPKGKKDEH